MTNLEKVYNTWKKIEKVFAATAEKKPLTRLEFAKKMLGAPDALVKLREMVNQDFDGSSESVEILNSLFRVLERAKERLGNAKEIESLDDFVWSDDWGEEPAEELSIIDFNPGTNHEYTPESVLEAEGVYDSVFTLGKDGKVKSLVANPNSKNLLVFRDSYGVLVWMSSVEKEFENEFVRRVYAVLAYGMKEKKMTLPICFTVSRGAESGVDFLDGCVATNTLSGELFECEVHAKSSVVSTVAGDLTVVRFEEE